MRGITLLVAALALVAPAGAQEYTWTADRPDGVAPVGISTDRTLAGGALEVAYRFARMEAIGLKFGNQPFSEGDALDLFTFVPLERASEAHIVTVGLGLTDAITLSGTGAWVMKTRTAANEEVFFSNESSGFSDAEVDALWQVHASGPWRGQLQMGVVIPTGSIEQEGDFPAFDEVAAMTDAQLPYDMQIGSGAWALVPGLGAQVMNQFGSVGAQVRAYFPLADNDRGWRPGNRVDGRAWLAYRFNDFVSASGGVRAMAFNSIQGADPDLETLRDPGDLALSFAGERVDSPSASTCASPRVRWPGTGSGSKPSGPCTRSSTAPRSPPTGASSSAGRRSSGLASDRWEGSRRSDRRRTRAPHARMKGRRPAGRRPFALRVHGQPTSFSSA